MSKSRGNNFLTKEVEDSSRYEVYYHSLHCFLKDTDNQTIEELKADDNRKASGLDKLDDTLEADNHEWRFGLSQVVEDKPKDLKGYYKERLVLTPKKRKLLTRMMREMKADKDVQRMILKAISLRKSVDHSKYYGIPNIPRLLTGQDKFRNVRKRKDKPKSIRILFSIGMSWVNSSEKFEKNFTELLKYMTILEIAGINYQLDMVSIGYGVTSGSKFNTFVTKIPIKNFSDNINYLKLFVLFETGLFRYNMFIAKSNYPGNISWGLGTPGDLNDLKNIYPDYELYVGTETAGDYKKSLIKIFNQ